MVLTIKSILVHTETHHSLSFKPNFSVRMYGGTGLYVESGKRVKIVISHDQRELEYYRWVTKSTYFYRDGRSLLVEAHLRQ